MKYDVFISYSSHDQKIVEAMCAYLEQRHIRCFVAYRDIPKGGTLPWAEHIVNALDESRMMLVAFSENFNASVQVNREIEIASEDKKPILTFRLSNAAFTGAKKYYLKNINWLDAFPAPEKVFDDMYKQVCLLLEMEPEPKKEPEEPFDAKEEGKTIDEDNNLLELLKKVPTDKIHELIKQRLANSLSKTDAPALNGHEAVDLGLPSGLKWASCNVGATKPEEYGGYYAWGETEEKSDYDWDTYKYCNGTSTSMTKYCTSSSYGTVDNKTTLEPTDDVATVKWGGSWRMPTKAEQDELRNNCTWTWTTLNGVNGYRVTGPNGNSIFLPAAGCRYGSEVRYRGSCGTCWPSSLSSSCSDGACYLVFGRGGYNWGNDDRYYGQSVRPVCP